MNSTLAPSLSSEHSPLLQTTEELVRGGAALVKSKQWHALIQLLKANKHLAEPSAQCHQLMGLAHGGLGDYKTAAFYFAKALTLEPNYVEASYYLGWALMELGDHSGAMKYLNQAIKLKPDHFDAMARLALLLRDINRPDLSLRWYQKIQAMNPHYDAIDNLIAIVYDALGDEEKADDCYEKCFRDQPDNAAFLFNMIYRKHYALDSQVVQQAHRLHERYKNTNSQEYLNCCYALGTAYDKNKQLDKAFAYYAEANQIQSQLIPSLLKDELEWTASVMEKFSASHVHSPQFSVGGCPSDVPIFVIGMPRSSTSLTEQILACHPDVDGSGELSLMRQITVTEITKMTHAAYPAEVTALQPQQVFALGQHYVNCLRTYSQAKHVVDKMPHNFFHVGLIQQILPNARIIHCVRDPVDTCWSIWRQIFYGRHTYKYDFDSLACAYGNYLKMMDHWHRLFPGKIYDFCYEELLENPEDNIRKLLQHCNLSWHDDCLNFHEKKRHVLTASTQQVRRPLYKSAVKSWEPVKTQLAPLIQALKKYNGIPERYLADYQDY